MTKKEYTLKRLKAILLYIFFFAAVLYIVSLYFGPPVHYFAPTIALVISILLFERWKYREWKESNY